MPASKEADAIDVTPEDQRAVALRIEAPADTSVTLWHTTDPVEIVARATKMANALSEVIRQKGLYKRIGDKDHIFVEAWTLCGTLLGITPVLEWSRPLPDGQGWEARVVAKTIAGSVVGAAEAMCTRKEGRWRNADDYALRSMAATRATSKALRSPLGFIVTLAGFNPTPAEEVPDGEPQQKQAQPAQQSPQAPKVDTLAELKRKIGEELANWAAEDRDAMLDAASHFTKDDKQYSIATVEALMRMRKNERWLQATLGNLRTAVAEREAAEAARTGEQELL